MLNWIRAPWEFHFCSRVFAGYLAGRGGESGSSRDGKRMFGDCLCFSGSLIAERRKEWQQSELSHTIKEHSYHAAGEEKHAARPKQTQWLHQAFCRCSSRFFCFSSFTYMCITFDLFHKLKWVTCKLSRLWNLGPSPRPDSSFSTEDAYEGLKGLSDWLNFSHCHFVCFATNHHTAFVYQHSTKGCDLISAFGSRK